MSTFRNLTALAVFSALCVLIPIGCTLRPPAQTAVEPASSSQYNRLARAKRDYPQFFVGPTGIMATIDNAQGSLGKVTVRGVVEGGPSAGKFEDGDILQAVNGKTLVVPDPRVPLGVAIGAAEGADGKLAFDVLRAGQPRQVTITIPAPGAYGAIWPRDCAKSKTIIRNTAEFIAKQHGTSEVGLSDCWAGLFLLSTGDDKYLPAVKDILRPLRPNEIGTHTWINGYRGVLLGEYYLRTGDKSVLPALKAVCDDASARQATGGWNHWGSRLGPGYTQGGLMNPAGIQMLTTLILARECGVEVNAGTYDRALRFFFRFAGTGGVAYGDHHPLLYLGDNGKTGMLAAALSLLDRPGFQRAAEVLTMDLMDSYDNIENGHGGDMFNVMWRGLAGVHTPARLQGRYRLHMDKLAWFYDLSRMPDGSFRKLPQMGHKADYLGEAPYFATGAIGLTYTAPLKTLRITGKPRTKFSVTPPPAKVEQSIVFSDFQRSDYVAGGDNAGLAPHELVNKFSGWWKPPHADPMPASFYAKIMRHYNPIFRSWAAHALGNLGDEAAGEYIAEALASDDARLRRAGFEAISGECFWGPGRAAVNISKDLVTSRYLPTILKAIKNPKTPMWEVESALWAVANADEKAIRDNLPALMPFFDNDEWFLRLAAMEAIRPLTKDPETARLVLPKLLSVVSREIHVYPRRQYDELLLRMLKDASVPKDIKDMIVAGRIKAMQDTVVATGFTAPHGLVSKFETMRYLLGPRPEATELMADDLVALTPRLSDLPTIWIYSGDRWGNPGLLKRAADLGKDAGRIIKALKTGLPQLKKRRDAADVRYRPLYDKTIADVAKAITDYEKLSK